jgi:hypothetical protein
MEFTCSHCHQSKNISTPEFLDKLDESQLNTCKELLQERLEKKHKEQKVKIWSVSQGGCFIKHFYGHEYLLAAEFLLETAKKSIEDGKPKEVGIDYQFIRESEVEHWIKMRI